MQLNPSDVSMFVCFHTLQPHKRVCAYVCLCVLFCGPNMMQYALFPGFCHIFAGLPMLTVISSSHQSTLVQQTLRDYNTLNTTPWQHTV